MQLPNLRFETEEARSLVRIEPQISAASEKTINPMRNEFDDHY